MHSRIYMLFFLLVLVVVALCAPSASASKPRPACAAGACVVLLKAAPKERQWRSPQRFGQVVVNIEVRSESGVQLRRKLLRGGCTGIYTGSGVFVRVDVCGRGPVPLRVRYRAKEAAGVWLGYEAVR